MSDAKHNTSNIFPGYVDGWSQIRTSYYNELLAYNRELREALESLYAQSAPLNHNGDAIWEAVKLQVKQALGKD